MRERRSRTPRGSHPEVALTPITVSQETSLAVLGIDARRYLQFLREHREIPRRRVGRLVVTAIASWMPDDGKSAARASASAAWDVDAAVRKAVSR